VSYLLLDACSLYSSWEESCPWSFPGLSSLCGQPHIDPSSSKTLTSTDHPSGANTSNKSLEVNYSRIQLHCSIGHSLSGTGVESGGHYPEILCYKCGHLSQTSPHCKAGNLNRAERTHKCQRTTNRQQSIS